MPRRQILSSEEKERLLVVPDDDVLLARMCFLSEHDLALINKHRRPANRLGFAVLLCYLRGSGFPPDKNISPHDGVVSRLAAHLKLLPDLWAEYASRGQFGYSELLYGKPVFLDRFTSSNRVYSRAIRRFPWILSNRIT